MDLPKNLDPAVLDRLKDTRISGQLINIQKDPGRPPRRDRDGRKDGRGHRGGGRGHGHGRDHGRDGGYGKGRRD